MDDMAAYYAPPPPPPGIPQYPYYPPPLSHAPPGTVVIAPQQFHLHHQPPPPYAPQSHVPQLYHDEVRTLFVAGLPPDVKSREIYNLFREFPGYESSHLRASSSNTQQVPFAFAVFLDQPSAVGAMHALNGLVFDLEKNSTLYIDLAKSNSRSKRSRTDDGRSGSEKRLKGYAAFPGGNPDPGVDSMYMPGMGNSAYNTIGYPSAQSHGSFAGGAVNFSTAAKHLAATQLRKSKWKLKMNNTPIDDEDVEDDYGLPPDPSLKKTPEGDEDFHDYEMDDYV